MFEKLKSKLSLSLASPDLQILSALDLPGVDAFRHSRGRSLADHLSGTRKILAAWDQAPSIQLAGLCHSIYSTEALRVQAVDLSERPRVARLIGAKAERLAYLFSVVIRQSLFSSVRTASSLGQADMVQVLFREGIHPIEGSISGREAVQLLIMHLANIAEQGSDETGRPKMWLAHFSYLCRNLKKSNEKGIPVFTSAQTQISRQTELLLRGAYSRGVMSVEASPKVASSHFLHCAEICPDIPEPHIWLAFLASSGGGAQNASQRAGRALQALDNWGTTWDKRLEFDEWRSLAVDLAEGRWSFSADALKRVSVSERERGVMTANEAAGVQIVGEPRGAVGIGRFISYLNCISQEGSRSSALIYPGLSKRVIHAPRDFTVVSELEERFDEICKEADNVCLSSFHAEAENISRSGSWKVFMLYESGRKNEENCLKCPTIVEILERHRCVRKKGGLIYLSRLAPHTHVEAHRGPTNMRVRCHLPLHVPHGDCGMRVDRQMLNWKEGQCVVFDDHFEHEVWNRTNESRIVLLVDLWHPELTPEEQNALEALQWYAYQTGLGLHKYWSLNEKQEEREGITPKTKDSGLHLMDEEGLLPFEDH